MTVCYRDFYRYEAGLKSALRDQWALEGQVFIFLKTGTKFQVELSHSRDFIKRLRPQR